MITLAAYHMDVFNGGSMMDCKALLKEALELGANDRFALVEGILKSLDEPDSSLDAIWAEEAEKRLAAYRSGKLDAVPMEQIFGSQ